MLESCLCSVLCLARLSMRVGPSNKNGCRVAFVLAAYLTGGIGSLNPQSLGNVPCNNDEVLELMVAKSDEQYL